MSEDPRDPATTEQEGPLDGEERNGDEKDEPTSVDGGPLHGGAGDPLGTGVEEAAPES